MTEPTVICPNCEMEIKETKKSARMAPNLPQKLELQRRLRGTGDQAR